MCCFLQQVLNHNYVSKIAVEEFMLKIVGCENDEEVEYVTSMRGESCS
jgi:hypothetical protein